MTIEKGDSGPAVTQLQRILNSILKPCPGLREDGGFGDKTLAALMQFQRTRGLKCDGIAGTQTLTALGLKKSFIPPNPAAPKPPVLTGDKKDWMPIARAELELGVKTLPGTDTHPHIAEYFDTTTYQPGDDETAWCSAFVNWVMKKAGYKGTRSAAAISWLDWGSALQAPKAGAVAIIHYKARNKPIEGCKPMTTGSGNHVAFFVSSSPTHIRLLGGNQGKKVSEVPFPLKCWDIKGYRWPS